MSKLKDSMMESDEKLLERAFRLMEYKYLATKYKQDMKHRAVGGVEVREDKNTATSYEEIVG